jgi:uncharacterized membrane protein
MRLHLHPPFLLRALLAFVGTLPWALVAFGHGAQSLRPLFRGFCHQMPDRSLAFFGATMAVCSRCAGIYAGIALGAVLPPPRVILRHGRAAVWIAASALLLDVMVQNYIAHTTIHALRLATGLAVGWAGCAFALGAMDEESRAHRSLPPLPQGPPEKGVFHEG